MLDFYLLDVEQSHRNNLTVCIVIIRFFIELNIFNDVLNRSRLNVCQCIVQHCSYGTAKQRSWIFMLMVLQCEEVKVHDELTMIE